MSTSVRRIMEVVTTTQLVPTITEASPARATQDTPEMESPAVVSKTDVSYAEMRCISARASVGVLSF